jgi:hypothetical protein
LSLSSRLAWKPWHAFGYGNGRLGGAEPGTALGTMPGKSPQSRRMITETNFLAEVFYWYSMSFFRQEKSFQDLF